MHEQIPMQQHPPDVTLQDVMRHLVGGFRDSDGRGVLLHVGVVDPQGGWVNLGLCGEILVHLVVPRGVPFLRAGAGAGVPWVKKERIPFAECVDSFAIPVLVAGEFPPCTRL